VRSSFKSFAINASLIRSASARELSRPGQLGLGELGIKHLASVPSLLILYNNHPLPLLGKEGSQPTNSPPRLRRGPGGGDCRVIRASWQIVKRDDTLVFPSCSSRTAARIIWLPWLGEPFGSRCTAKKAHRLRLFDPASQRTRKPSGARERPTLATRRVFSSNPALVGEMRCFQVGSDRDHFKDSRIG